MKTFSPELPAVERAELTNLQLRASSRGYAIIRSDLLATPQRLEDLADFLRHIGPMPAEAYDDKITRRRFVTYAHYYKPNEASGALLYFTEPEYDIDVGTKLVSYYLSPKVNPDPKGLVRKFAPVPDTALEHRFLHQLIEAGFHAAPLPAQFRKSPIEVEVQFIRYEPRRGTDAVGTPPTTHQDNDWAFCVFLLEWDNIEGPLNAFVALDHVLKPIKDVPDDKILDTVSLVKPLQGYCVEDTKVAHFVGPVRLAAGSEYGRRTIVILSYKPLVPLRPADVNETTNLLRQRPDLLAAKPPVAGEINAKVASDAEEDGMKPRGTTTRRPRSEPQPIVLTRALYA